MSAVALLTAFLAGTWVTGGDGPPEVPIEAAEPLAPAPPPAGPDRGAPEPGRRTYQSRGPRGAAEASLRYLAAFSDVRLLSDRRRRRALVDRLAVPAYRDELAARLEETYGFMAVDLGLGGDPTRVVLRVVPVGYRVESLSGDRAQVAVWHVALAGQADGQVIAGWTTSRLGLRWDAGEWRLERIYADEVGPTPHAPAGVTPTAPAQLVATAATFEPLP